MSHHALLAWFAPGGDRSRTDTSFEDSYDGLYTAAYRVAFRLTEDNDTAEHLAREALVRAHDHWPLIMKKALPWVTRRVVDLAIDDGRRQKRHSTASA